MVGNLQQTHIKERLKIIHLFSIFSLIGFFLLFFLLNKNTNLDTITTQYIIILMAILTALSYLTISFHSTDKIPTGPAFLFIALNILNSCLVWSTGIFNSPFIILYAILIITGSQIYHYKFGLLQTVLALIGFVFVYGATSARILPYSSILLYSDISILYQPPLIILTYGLFYSILFVFAVFASSSARVVLFQAQEKSAINTTYQEKIIQELPSGVMILDWELNILSANPAANYNFPIENLGAKITKYLSLNKTKPQQQILNMSNTCEEKQLMWTKDDGEVIPVKISVRIIKSKKKIDSNFILFLDRLTH